MRGRPQQRDVGNERGDRLLRGRTEVETLHHSPSEQDRRVVVAAGIEDERGELEPLGMLDREPGHASASSSRCTASSVPSERAERIEVEGGGLAPGDRVAELGQRAVEHAR